MSQIKYALSPYVTPPLSALAVDKAESIQCGRFV